jgi:hypothetical protein
MTNHWQRTETIRASAKSRCSTVGPVPDACFEQRGKRIANAAPSTVFLFDVDNTLLDHDRENADLREHLDSALGRDRARRYWELFEQIRIDVGYNDYLGAWQRYRLEDPH